MTPTIEVRVLTFALTALLAASPAIAKSDDSASQSQTAGRSSWTAPASFAAAAPAQKKASPQATAALGRALTRSGIVLPAGGIDEACAGIRSLGNCIAAMHLAKNLKVDGGFAAVRSIMTYDEGASLGDVIRELAPEADPAAAEKLAREQAAAEMRQAGGNLAAL